MILTDTRRSKRKCRKLKKRKTIKNKGNTRKLEQIQTRKQESGSNMKEKEEMKRMREKLLPQKLFFSNYNFIFPL
jgi:hypothetical protein